MSHHATLTPSAPGRPRACVIVGKIDAEGPFNREHGVVLGGPRRRCVSTRADVGPRGKGRAVGEVLQAPLIHENPTAVDGQRDHGKEGDRRYPEDHDDLAAAGASTRSHQYSVFMAAVATM